MTAETAVAEVPSKDLVSRAPRLDGYVGLRFMSMVTRVIHRVVRRAYTTCVVDREGVVRRTCTTCVVEREAVITESGPQVVVAVERVN